MSEIITEEWLRDRNACERGIKFAVRNKLIGASLDQICEVEGDFEGFVDWIKDASKHNIEHDEHGNVIKRVFPGGDVYTYKYDENNNMIKKVDSFGFALTCEYDQNNNRVKEILPNGDVWTFEYDQNNNLIKETDSFGITYEYDDHNNRTTYKYDDHGNPIKRISPSGQVQTWEYLYYDNGQLKEIVDYVKFPKIEEK